MVGKQGGSGTLEKGGNRKVGGGQKRTLRRGVFKGGRELTRKALQTEKLMECVEQGLLIPALQGWVRTSSQGSTSGTWRYHCFLL